MKELLDLINDFEERNNMSIVVIICSDGSANIEDFWDNDILEECKDIEALADYLKNTQYKLSEDGRCISPVQIIKS